MTASALVIIDYQNIHLTAHERFAPSGTPKHETLVHPLHFANQVIGARNNRVIAAGKAGIDVPPCVQLAAVHVYRGLPSNRHNPTAYRRSMAQKSEWTRDRRVDVTYRTLRYLWDHNLKTHVPTEKGIDVMLALDLVRSMREHAADVVILATHDTDLEPALDEAMSFSDGCLIETAGWENARRLRSSASPLAHKPARRQLRPLPRSQGLHLVPSALRSPSKEPVGYSMIDMHRAHEAGRQEAERQARERERRAREQPDG